MSVNVVFQDYLTPLHVAAHCGNVKIAKLLLDLNCEVNARALVCTRRSAFSCTVSLQWTNVPSRYLDCHIFKVCVCVML